MNKMIRSGMTSFLVAASMVTFAQEEAFSNKDGSEYKFTKIKDMEATEVQNLSLIHI